MTADLTRCPWPTHDLYIHYHDSEWGVPLHDDHRLFEAIVLDGAQAGLSWSIILKKRENYRAAFDKFDPEKVARYGERKIKQLLANEGIVRNRMKIESAIGNAKVFLKIQEEHGTFDQYLWRFVEGKPIQNRWQKMKQVPARTPLSDAISKELLGRGMRFFGTTICYAFMQAIGMVNDHLVGCFRHSQVAPLR